MFKPKSLIASTVALSALMLASCGAEDAEDKASESAEATAAVASQADSSVADESESAITLERGVVRAKPAESAMTGIFGTLTNHTDKDLEIKGFDSNLDAGKHEIHEVVDGVMREVQEPMVIPANGTVELKPGGNHFMIMDFDDEIKAGETVDLTVTFSDDSTAEIKGVAVREMGAGDENYGDLEHGEMGHGEAKHGEKKN